MRTVLVQMFLTDEQAKFIIEKTGSEGQTLGTQNRNIANFLRGFCGEAVEKILTDLGAGPALPQTGTKAEIDLLTPVKPLEVPHRHRRQKPEEPQS